MYYIGGELAEVVGLVPGEGEAAVEEKASESNGRSIDPGFRAEGISVADVEEEQADEDCGLRGHPSSNKTLLRSHCSTDKETK